MSSDEGRVRDTAEALALALAAGGGLGGSLSIKVDPATLLPLLEAQTNLLRDDIAGIGVADNTAAFTQVRQDIAGIVIPPPVSLTQVNSKLDAILASLTPVTPPPANLMPTIGLTTSVLVATDPGSALISTTPADPDGTVLKVEIMRNGSRIATLLSAPYTYTDTGLVAGQYSYTGKVYDNSTGTAVSAASLVTINPVVVVPPPLPQIDPIPLIT